IRDVFGQTERTLQIENTPGQNVKAGSLGRVLPGYNVVLIDPATDDVVEGPGEGEVCLTIDPRPVGLMAGYHTDQAKNAAAFRDGSDRTAVYMYREPEDVFT